MSDDSVLSQEEFSERLSQDLKEANSLNVVREGNRDVFDLRVTEEEVRVEKIIRLTIEEPVYANGKNKPDEDGEKPVKVNEKKIEVKAADVAALSHLVTQIDGIDITKDEAKFFDAHRRRLAKLLGVKSVAQQFANQLTQVANDMLSQQKKSDSATSRS